MSQKLSRLIHYFRTYTYPSDSLEGTESSDPLTTLQQCISNARALIDTYEQKIHLMNVQNETLSQDNQQLKLSMAEDKKQAEKLLQRQRQAVDQLRKQLMEKDLDNRLLQQKIQQLQIIQADELSSMQKQQHEDAFIFQDKLQQQKIHYEAIVSRLQEDLNDEKHYNLQLLDKINALTIQLQTVSEDNARLTAYIEQSNVQQMQYCPYSSTKKANFSLQHLQAIPTEPFIPQLQIIDHSQTFQINNSQDQIMNYSYEAHPTALKDVLNFSGCTSSRFNMTREFMHSKQKQNIDDNAKLTHTNSSKKILMSSQKRKLHMSTNTKHPTNRNQSSHNIKQFTTANDSTNIDPYFVFFALTAQCIKINSQNFEQIAQIDIVEEEWNRVLEQRIPMNLWGGHLEKALHQNVVK